MQPVASGASLTRRLDAEASRRRLRRTVRAMSCARGCHPSIRFGCCTHVLASLTPQAAGRAGAPRESENTDTQEMRG